MRGLIPVAAWILLIGLALVPLTHGDIIQEGHHAVGKQIRINNLSEFPDFVLIGYVTGPMIQTYEVYLVEENAPLTKGYKFNTLKLFAIESEVLSTAGGLEAIDFQALSRTMSPAAIPDPCCEIVPDTNPLESEHYDYEIESVSEHTLVLALTRKVSTFNDGQADTIEEF
jgi:hypothetical protein